MELSIITLGEKAEAILGNHPFNKQKADNETFFLIITDDAAAYEESVDKIIQKIPYRNPTHHLVVDMNVDSDYAQFKSAWENYNKVKDAQTVKDLVTLIQYHVVQLSITHFDAKHLLFDICGMDEYLGSIYVEGIEGLKEVNVPSNAKSLVVAVGFMDLSSVTMEQMDNINDFYIKFGDSISILYSVSTATTPKDEVVIVYSYNK